MQERELAQELLAQEGGVVNELEERVAEAVRSGDRDQLNDAIWLAMKYGYQQAVRIARRLEWNPDVSNKHQLVERLDVIERLSDDWKEAVSE
jgi:hypothetical protein